MNTIHLDYDVQNRPSSPTADQTVLHVAFWAAYTGVFDFLNSDPHARRNGMFEHPQSGEIALSAFDTRHFRRLQNSPAWVTWPYISILARAVRRF
jgi:hypothetical protein